MTTDQKLEVYLTKLEKVLSPFPVSDRAEIVTEIKSHVLAAIERDPSTDVASVLSALGEPDTVANRYLIERGLKPTKPSLSPIIKWIVLGFLGTSALIMLFVAFVLIRFSPVLHVDDIKNKVTLLGGAIEVDGKTGSVWMSNGSGEHSLDATFDEGSVITNHGDKIAVNFGNGKMELDSVEGVKFSWHCEGAHAGKSGHSIKTSTNPLEFDLTEWMGAKCQFEIPNDTYFAIHGQNGKVQLDKPRFNVDLNMLNGKVNFSPEEDAKYKFDISVMNGKSDSFESSSDPKAYEIKMHLTNGKLTND